MAGCHSTAADPVRCWLGMCWNFLDYVLVSVGHGRWGALKQRSNEPTKSATWPDCKLYKVYLLSLGIIQSFREFRIEERDTCTNLTLYEKTNSYYHHGQRGQIDWDYISDSHLSFDLHTSRVCQTVNVRSKLLKRIRSFITYDFAKTLYPSLIEPHFLYGNFLSEGTIQANWMKLKTQQNCVLCTVERVNMYYPSVRLRTAIGVDNMKKTACKMAFKCFYDRGPDSLQ